MAIATSKRAAADARRAADVEKRKSFFEYDEAPAEIEDHAFVPRAQWWTKCKICGLAQAAHNKTTVDQLAEIRADHARQEERRTTRIGYVGDSDDHDSMIGYVGDDDDE